MLIGPLILHKIPFYTRTQKINHQKYYGASQCSLEKMESRFIPISLHIPLKRRKRVHAIYNGFHYLRFENG